MYDPRIDDLRYHEVIDHLFDLLHLDTPCTLTTLLRALEGACRRTFVVVASDQIPGNATVATISHPGGDAICWRATLTPTERSLAICHALAHIIFHHPKKTARFCEHQERADGLEYEANIGASYLHRRLTFADDLVGLLNTERAFISMRSEQGSLPQPLMAQLPDVQRTFTAIQDVLGSAFLFEQLIPLVEHHRQKRLVFETVPMVAGKTGEVISLRDVDVVRIRKGLDAIRVRATRLHECSHLLLDHLPRGDTGTPTYAEFRNSPTLQESLSRDHAVTFSPLIEYAAEALATLLLECIEQSEQAMPRMPEFVEQFWR